ncbi:MAG TPA: glycosyltransferase [Candidatus Sulfotelmatobacter sp.]|jgi:alpha-1,6-mannosyltransferase
MKTLHLTNAWHETSGGIATFYRALIAAANRKGHDIRLVVPAPADRVEEVGEFGRIYHVLAPKAFLNSEYRAIFPSQFLSPGSKLQKILAFESPDLIEISDKYTLNYLGALLRMQLVQTLNYRPLVVGLSQERMDDNVRAYFGSIPFSQKFCSIYMKWFYFPFFDHHIANSEYTAAELRAAARGQLVPRKTWIRSMGVDLAHFSPQRRRPELRRRLLQNLGVAEDAALLLYAGRLAPEKNLQLLFDLMARLACHGQREYRLLVVGDGVDREFWERRCDHDLRGRVQFFGHIADKNVLADIYASSDVFVHPNPREPFGIAPLEAMASGIPLVAPNSGGVVSYANPRNAWTVHADVESFADAVREAVTNRTAAAEKTQRALATANQYRWETVTQSFLELYEQLLRLRADVGQLSGPTSSSAFSSTFSSTPATGFHAALMRGVAATAIAMFRMCSKIASRSHSRRPRLTADPAVRS